LSIENESLPKIIIINNTINLFLKTAIKILVISHHNSFQVLFDKVASVISFEKCIYILALEMDSPGNQQCANCIGTLSFPILYAPTARIASNRHLGRTENSRSSEYADSGFNVNTFNT